MKTPYYQKIIDIYRAAASETELNPLRQAELKQQLLQRLSEPPAKEAAWTASLTAKSPTFAYIMVSSLMCLMISAGAVFASQASLPGENLYSVKRFAEKLELGLSTNARIEAAIGARHATSRLNELSQLKLKQGSDQDLAAAARVAAQERQTEQETRVQLETALNKLTEVKGELQAKGNFRAAASLETVIDNLTNQASQQKFIIDREKSSGRLRVNLLGSLESDPAAVGAETKKDGTEVPTATSPAESLLESEGRVNGEQDVDLDKAENPGRQK